MFVNTLPIILKYNDSKDSLESVMKSNTNVLIDLYDNKDISFSHLMKLLKLKSVNNLFDFQPKQLLHENSSHSIFNDEIDETFYYDNNNKNMSKFNLSLNAIEKDSRYFILLEYNKKMYDSTMINSIINSYVNVATE